jgi:hypothetical protein
LGRQVNFALGFCGNLPPERCMIVSEFGEVRTFSHAELEGYF